VERKGEEAVFLGLLETMGQVEGEEKKIKNKGGRGNVPLSAE
jgi:hypothetical protein